MSDHQNRRKISDVTSNLRVAVRVRPMNLSELEDKCTNIIKSDTSKMSVMCKGKPFGPFFRVYDSKTTQSDIYADLVSSQIKKVIAGFNCTVFAYGQTGTGKTFTMEGGRTDAKSSTDDPTTGMIPRAVEDIFEQLESLGCEEYSLRVSYVELYNEELFDLLAVNSDADDRERLRIFDDPSKKGVIVSGVEEVPVRNRADVYKLLELGAEKRKTAATLMNMRSSRSHSLFMVNVVVRENTHSGEELVKQGKLNLVDLAGSENIGRSGAQGNRAKEAGSINQSLLTLGRVIRSLTTNAQHIPYRESKLTRLLQDSLGGSTITSLIATLSPASSNFEESQSTLEYAVRAANIKNKPVCNTKVSKKTILKEYSDEIEKLRRDLRAAREKNGVIISEESHEEFQKNTERVHELEEQLDSVVDRLRRFTEDLMHMDEQYKKLFERKGELEDRLRIRLREMAEKEKELADLKDDLTQYQLALEKMHIAASQTFVQLKQMTAAADDMRYDLGAYWKKVDELKACDEKNADTVHSFVKEVSNFVSRTVETNKNTMEKCRQVSNDIEEKSAIPCNFLDDASVRIRENLNGIETDTLAYLKNSMERDSSNDTELQKIVKETRQQLKSNINDLRSMVNEFSSDSQSIVASLVEKLNALQTGANEFREEVNPLLDEIRGTLADDLNRRELDRKEADENVNTMAASLKNDLQKMIGRIEEMEKSNKSISERSQLGDQEVLERGFSTISTIGDVVTNLDDIVAENTEDVDCVKTDAEKKCADMDQNFQESTSNAEEIMEKNMILIVKNSSETVEDAKSARSEYEASLKNAVKDHTKIGEECVEVRQKVVEISQGIAENLNRTCDQFDTKTAEDCSNINQKIESVSLSHVDANENVPSRSTPQVFTENELEAPPEPETLLNVALDTEENEEDRQNATSYTNGVKNKRRVTGFVRRDSLLDTTNLFQSPSSIQKRRELTIDEEDGENYSN